MVFLKHLIGENVSHKDVGKSERGFNVARIQTRLTMSMAFPFQFDSDDPALEMTARVAAGDIAGNIKSAPGGLLTKPEPCLQAGLVYGMWTRDASFNSWNGFGLLAPEVDRSTLLAVLKKEKGVVSIGGEYWDSIIWIIGVWHHYLITGDLGFLRTAYDPIVTTLRQREAEEFDSVDGLFCGAACYGDGVSAYPDRYATSTGGIGDWKKENKALARKMGGGVPMKTLSTNALYLRVYQLLPLMERELNRVPSSEWKKKADALTAAMQRAFWNARLGRYNYLCDEAGTSTHQEGLGHAFALLFGLADAGRAKKIVRSIRTTRHGIPCLTPDFPRYRMAGTPQRGRHCGLVWLHINALWARACAQSGAWKQFDREFALLTEKVLRDHFFSEIYHDQTGLPYGGVQELVLREKKPWHPIFLLGSRGKTPAGRPLQEWISAPRQTWCATGWLAMVLEGIFGLRFSSEGLTLQPRNVTAAKRIEMSGLVLRKKPFSMTLTGRGQCVRHILVNGRKLQRGRLTWDAIPQGEVKIEIAMSA